MKQSRTLPKVTVIFLLFSMQSIAQEIDTLNTTLRLGKVRSNCLVDIRDNQLAMDEEGCIVDFWILNLDGLELMGKGNKLSSEALKQMANLPEGARIEICAIADLDQENSVISSGEFIYTRVIVLPELRWRL